jgi:hypothetical protein
MIMTRCMGAALQPQGVEPTTLQVLQKPRRSYKMHAAVQKVDNVGPGGNLWLHQIWLLRTCEHVLSDVAMNSASGAAAVSS